MKSLKDFLCESQKHPGSHMLSKIKSEFGVMPKGSRAKFRLLGDDVSRVSDSYWTWHLSNYDVEEWPHLQHMLDEIEDEKKSSDVYVNEYSFELDNTTDVIKKLKQLFGDNYDETFEYKGAKCTIKTSAPDTNFRGNIFVVFYAWYSIKTN